MGRASPSDRFFTFSHRALLATLLATTAVVGGTGISVRPAMAQTGQVTDFNVPSGPLNRALATFGTQSGTQLSYEASIASGLSSPGARGALSREAALDQILQGSGLVYSFAGARTVVITRPDTSLDAGAADGTITLGTIVVQGDGGTTEGTGSYTTGETSTSIRLPLSIRNTPQSVSVVTSQQILDQGAKNVTDVLAYTTGYFASESQQLVKSRGFDANQFLVDGMSSNYGAGWINGLLSSSAMYDHVEVVRGATGFLNGSGSLGGAINLVRKRATAETPQVTLETRAGSWDAIGLTFDGQTPLNKDGSLRGRLVYDRLSTDSFRDRYHTDRELIYGTIAYDLTPDTTLTFSAHRSTDNPEGYEWSHAATIYSDGTPTALPRGFSTAPSWNRMDTEETSVTAEIEHQFSNGWKATASIGEYRANYDNEMAYTGSIRDRVTGLAEGNPYPWAATNDNRKIAGNAMISGPVSFAGRTHDLTFGVSTQREWGRYRSASGSFTDYPDAYNIPLWDWNGDLPRFDVGNYSNRDWSRGASMVAAYGAGNFTITEKLRLIAGMRYSKWESGIRKFNEITPYYGVIYDLNDQLSAYVGYTDIFSPQNAKDRSGGYLDPVVGKAYEAGLKAEMFDGRLNASLSLFRNFQDNVAVSDDGFLVPGTTDQAYIGVKGAETKGVEVEVSGEIRPGWNAFAGVSYANATDAEGERLDSTVPRSSAKLFTTYRLTGAADRWTVGGGMRWQDKTWADINTSQGTFRFTQGGYPVADVMVRYDLSDSLSAQLNIKNLFDKVYYENAGVSASYGAPRNVMLTLTSRF